MGSKSVKVVSAIVGAVLLSAGFAPVAMAGGAQGGDFDCQLTGIPRVGHVVSSYRIAGRHYATAKGTGTVTIHANGNQWATATTGRALSNNACYYGMG
jgi:hypothetical protein